MTIRVAHKELPAWIAGLVWVATAIAACTALSIGFASKSLAGAAEIVSATQGLTIQVNKGQLVRLDQAAGTVFVADPEIADVQVKSPTLVYIFGKKAGETTLFADNGRSGLILNMNVQVTHNLNLLNATLDELLPEGTVQARTVNESVILSGRVTSAAEAEDARRIALQFVGGEDNVINRLEVLGPSQVQLRVRIVETSRSTMRELGINWDGVFTFGAFTLGLATGGATFPGAIFPPGPGDGLFQTRQGGVNNLGGNFANNDVNVSTLIDALENEGLVKVLAEPSLTALTGETASFLAGGEFPIPVPQDNNVVTIQFKQFGVGLAFTPTLVSQDRINVRVKPEVSQLSNAGAITLGGLTVPALTTRRAETTVELASGQSFAIAGLLQHDINHDIGSVPGLGDLPVLGPLFRSENFRRAETELVVLVTPFIIKPMRSSNAVVAGADGDAGGVIIGPKYLGRPRTGEGPQSGEAPQLVGPVGFILE